MLSLSQTCMQSQKMTQDQKLALKALLSIGLRLKHPENPNCARGLDGMKIADYILKEKNSAGILIGGLAESVWSQKRTREELNSHKDVDVIVLNSDVEPLKEFEGGIDWWLPKSRKININSYAGSAEGIEQKWYENANKVKLSFGLNQKKYLIPGLYLPGPDWIVMMRECEANANIDQNKIDIEFDDVTYDKFRDEIRKRVKTKVPKFICDSFTGYILDSQYEKDYKKIEAVGFEQFDIETIRAINKLGNLEEKAIEYSEIIR